MLNPEVGMPIEVVGANGGLYIVNSYTPYAPAIPPGAGTASTLRSSVLRLVDFDVTPLSLTVSRGGTAYPATLNTATTGLAGQLSAFNAAKGAAPFIASWLGRLLITETSGFYRSAADIDGRDSFRQQSCQQHRHSAFNAAGSLVQPAE